MSTECNYSCLRWICESVWQVVSWRWEWKEIEKFGLDCGWVVCGEHVKNLKRKLNKSLNWVLCIACLIRIGWLLFQHYHDDILDVVGRFIIRARPRHNNGVHRDNHGNEHGGQHLDHALAQLRQR